MLNSYVLSIVGVVFLGVLVDVIMPDGEMNKYVKGVFSMLALFVIMSPVQKLFNKDFSLENMFYDNTSIAVDSDFLEATTKQMKKQCESVLIARLKDAGFDGVDVEILAEMSNYEFQIKKVIIDISKMVIIDDGEHINKYAEIKAVVLENFDVEESDVIINEWTKKWNKNWKQVF